MELEASMEPRPLWSLISYTRGHYTANEGPVRIQYKCLVPNYVFPEMKLCSLVISLLGSHSFNMHYVYCQASGVSSAVPNVTPAWFKTRLEKNEIRPHLVLNQPYRQLNNSVI
jgi:hypothetical protein